MKFQSKDILGGRHLAFEKYDKVFFKKFRKENIVQLAVEFAQVVLIVHLFNQGINTFCMVTVLRNYGLGANIECDNC